MPEPEIKVTTKTAKEIENINKYLTEIVNHPKALENDTYIASKINMASRYIFLMTIELNNPQFNLKPISKPQDKVATPLIKFVEKQSAKE
jgi:hypothetical protein